MKALLKALWPFDAAGPRLATPGEHFLAACPEALLVTAADGAVLFANEGVRELLACDSQESLRRFPELLSAPSFEAYRAARRECLEAPAEKRPPVRLELSLHCREGDRWLDDVHGEDASRVSNAWREAQLSRGKVTLEYRLRRVDGQYRKVVEHAAPVHGPHGAFEGFVGLCQDVTDARRAQEAEDVERREELERTFVANVSHELRTPVAAIRGFAETLRMGAIGRPKVAGEFVETIERHANRLHRLIEDLLEISLLESGRRDARPEPVVLAPFVWDYCKRLASAADRKKVRLRVAIDPELVVWIDALHLGQVLENLCDNAIKFNRKGGSVTIEARADGAEAMIRIQDTGPGVAPDQLPVLFDRFLRKTTASSQAAPSTGLGLSIVKAVVELYGGTIAVDSSSRGAAFTLRLPLQPRELAAPRPAAEAATP